MKKSLISGSILSKVKNVTTLKFLRQIYYLHSSEMMHHQQQQQGQHYYKNRPNMQQQQQQNQRDDLLRNFRKWIRTEVSEKSTVQSHSNQIFTVLNYNILSQKLLEMHSYLYNRHEKAALHWDLRLHNVIGEVFRAQPSVLCLQVRVLE